MAGVVVVGAQWGDEGKGKIVDLLTQTAEVVVRYQGGHNAGHTVVIGEEVFILHLIPAGILRPGKVCVIGNGAVVDPVSLLQEVRDLERRGITVQGRFFVSSLAHLILPYHKMIEKQSETLKGLRRIGTTGRGIGPTYADKMARVGIRIETLFDPKMFRELLAQNLEEINARAPITGKGLSLEAVCEEYLAYADQLRPYVADASLVVNRALDEGRHVLFEGAQGTLLDVDHGTYPFVTSSSTVAGGACIGTGVGPTRIDRVLGVAKVYTTRVGSGPFPTELTDEQGEYLQRQGHEYGATTGRRRRCGWFDAVAVRYAVRVNGLTGLAMTKLDVLDACQTIKVCVGYRVHGAIRDEWPGDLRTLEACEPVYETLEGWRQPTTGLTEDAKLPPRARQLLDRIEALVGCPVDLVSTSSQRDVAVCRRDPFRSMG